MILIADAGSTKVHWVMLEKGREPVEFRSSSLNPLILSEEDIRGRIKEEVLPQLSGREPRKIRFYGAGCISEVVPQMERVIAETTGCGCCRVESDMLGAARALCGDVPGVACVIGTGSNSCLYDGRNITDNIPPLGYILGDEGSGASIGRRLAGDIYKRQLPADICSCFERWLGMDRGELIGMVYRGQEPNKFLASFTRFIAAHIDRVELRSLVTDEFVRFLRRNVAMYGISDGMAIYFTGSVAWCFRQQLLDALDCCGMVCGGIVREPMNGLVDYHTRHDINP